MGELLAPAAALPRPVSLSPRLDAPLAAVPLALNLGQTGPFWIKIAEIDWQRTRRWFVHEASAYLALRARPVLKALNETTKPQRNGGAR